MDITYTIAIAEVDTMTDKQTTEELKAQKPTILQWFESAFQGFDHNQVGDSDGLMRTGYDLVRLNGLPYPERPELNGNLQCTCGGDVLITWTPVAGMRGRVFLIRDDSTGAAWEYEQIKARQTRPRPAARLRLVYSA